MPVKVEKSDALEVEFKKADDELQIVWGEVYAPGIPDSQGDFMSAEEIRKMAYRFMTGGRVSKIDVNHDRKDDGGTVVESFIARPGDPDFIAGAWVLGTHIPDKQLWQRVKNGELNGYSIDGSAMGEKKRLKLDMPEKVAGETKESAGHNHSFTVRFDPEGSFIGGKTGLAEGHSHEIKRGTVTEEAEGHVHRYSFTEGLMKLQSG